MRFLASIKSTLLRFTLACLVVVCLQHTCGAQSVTIRAGFLEDSLKIGEPTRFYLSAHYGDSLSILFPDSTFKFSTFEFDHKVYFATKTKDRVSVDSAIYFLSTFEVDRAQALQLPVFVVEPQDCTQFQSAADTIFITQMVAEVPDSLSADKLPLKMNTAYHQVLQQFNYWILIIVVGVLVVCAIVVWIFFGKRIARHFRAKRLKRKHNEFITRYGEIVQQLQTGFSSNHAETALSFWKKYMEVLEPYPFTKLTTLETFYLTKDESLAKNLRQIDRAIYADQPTVLTPFEQLRAFADRSFMKKLQEVQHG